MLQTFNGHTPEVHDTAWVHDGAWVIGEVRLGEQVSIWPTAVLRGDMGPIVVGDQSNIQDGTVCHNTGGWSETHIGKRVTVGHKVILHGCRVEDDCLIGMGAIVMDTVVVGAGSVVGAGALITAGKIIPPNSLVLGSPAKVVREVTQRERQMITLGWQEYVTKMAMWQ